ncbi:WbqC family protein [Sunxiuqinia sp. A32]|uniref:WbqC family protein n=1 Tax=Sunxiuqinia sp. A32 TaxID=3461496 RepID=UPI0040457D7A
MDNQAILLSTAYLPPIQYISKFLSYNTIWLEAFENFTKQTYRNRTIILGANGPESLVVPVEKGRSKQLVCDLKISYDTNWQHIHWQAIVSAYNSSPFFEFLEADFIPFFQKKYEYLFDYNLQIMQVIFEILEIKPNIKQTLDFEQVEESCLNFREAIHPKPKKAIIDPNFKQNPYSQVFDDKFGFTPNLSILDLLFNCGSESYSKILEYVR